VNQTLTRVLPRISPTARLIAFAIEAAQSPLSIATLSEMTGSSPGALEKLTRRLVKQDILAKTNNGSIALYTFATPEAQ